MKKIKHKSNKSIISLVKIIDAKQLLRMIKTFPKRNFKFQTDGWKYIFIRQKGEQESKNSSFQFVKFVN